VRTRKRPVCHQVSRHQVSLEPHGDKGFAVKAVRGGGKFPSRSLSATVSDLARYTRSLDRSASENHSKEAAEQRFAGAEAASSVILPVPDFSTDSESIGIYPLAGAEYDSQNYLVYLSASNGSWIEQIFMKREKDHWAQAIIVSGDQNKRLLTKVDPDYPKDERGEPLQIGIIRHTNPAP
jgi:hypothetical protein